MKAVFLNIDGTIVRDIHYCRTPDDFKLLPAVPEAISLLNNSGFTVVVITNQPGIAKGYFNEEMLAQIHEKMEDELARYGARVDAIYYCSHYPYDRYDCHESRLSLFRKAVDDLAIDLKSSYFIGNVLTDIEASKALGCKAILVATGANPVINPEPEMKPDYMARDLYQSAQWIVNQGGTDKHPLFPTPDMGFSPTFHFKP